MSFFSTLVKDIEGFPAAIVRLFESPAAAADLKQAAVLAVSAQPYVAEIEAVITPFLGAGGALTVAAVNAAYQKYAVPLAQAELTSPSAMGNALLNLATGLLQAHAPAASVTLLNTAVQLAKVAVSANGKVHGSL